ncbi:hypothetical protein KC8_03465 [Sphingomonas sp. KC8]|nr:hypothetical protein KC8_03465 [Sphingomonas sp. KC8]
MRIFITTASLFVAAAIGVAGPAAAQDQGYRLLVENGVDAIAVRHVVADRLGEPAATGSISKQILADANSVAQLRAESAGRATIIVGCPELVNAMGGSATGARKIATDLARILPADSLAVARIN